MPSLPHPTTSNPLLIDFSTVEPSTPILRIPLVLQVSPLLKVTSLRDQLNTHGGIPLPLSPSTLSEIQALNRRIRASDAGAWAKLASERLVDEAMDAYFEELRESIIADPVFDELDPNLVCLMVIVFCLAVGALCWAAFLRFRAAKNPLGWY